MFPIKLAATFAKLAQKHGYKVMHSSNVDLLTADLGDALRRQKKAMQDPDLGIFETAYEVLPIIAEVKILTVAVSRKLGLDTANKSTIEVLEEIVASAENRNSRSATQIKNTLEWTRDFFSQPEIQEILKADLIEVEAPTSWRDFAGMGRSALQGTQRAAQEFGRLQEFLRKAKDPIEKKNPPNNGPTP